MNEEHDDRKDAEDELREEYDLDELLKGAKVGLHAEQYALGTNLVRLDPDVACAFRDSEAVNAALRLLIEAAGLARTERGP